MEYFHVVFTVPDTFHALFRGNLKLLYGLLFKASSQTLAQIAADRSTNTACLSSILVEVYLDRAHRAILGHHEPAGS